jgi:hypothetical protein
MIHSKGQAYTEVISRKLGNRQIYLTGTRGPSDRWTNMYLQGDKN